MILSVKKAMRILTTLSLTHGKPLTLSKISEITKINKSTCSHILSTLINEGYIERISHTKGFILGPASFCLSDSKRYSDDFIEKSRPVMKWLNKKTDYVVVLSTLRGNNKFIIDYIDPQKDFFPNTFNIQYDDIYRTSTGRIMLANLKKNDLLEIFKRQGIPKPEDWKGIDSFETLCAELDKINKNDVIKIVDTDLSNENLYVIGYGAAIFKHYEQKGAIGVALRLPKSEYDQFCKEKETEIKNSIISARNEINRRISCL